MDYSPGRAKGTNSSGQRAQPHQDKLGHKLTRTKGTIVKTSSLLELKLVTSLSLNFLMGVRHHCRRDVMVNLKMMVMLLARAVLQKRRMEARRKSCLVNIFYTL